MDLHKKNGFHLATLVDSNTNRRNKFILGTNTAMIKRLSVNHFGDLLQYGTAMHRAGWGSTSSSSS